MLRTAKYAAAVLLAVVVGVTGVIAQEEKPEEDPYKWRKNLVVDFTAAQSAYSDSWTGGEAGSFSWVGNLNGNARKQLNEWFSYKGQLKLSFGQTVTQDEETNKWSKPQKSTDLIDWENVGLFLIGAHVDPYVAFRLETQFLDASVEAKDRYLSPMKLTESAGLSHRFYEMGDDHVTARVGGAVRQIITQDIIDMTTYETETNTETSAGLELVADAILSFHDNLQYTGKLTLFQGFYDSQSDETEGTVSEDDWKVVDVNWENIVTAQITKIIAVNFYTQILYDKQVIDKARFKETLGIGFLFKLI